MSHVYNNFQNIIPIIEKYINNIYISNLEVNLYNDNYKNYNYFVLEQADDNNISYILRIKNPIKNYQIFTCGAGGNGGLIYGSGGNGGNYLYIDNISNDNQINNGSYLIIPGKAIDIFSILEKNNNYNNLLSKIIIDGSFYLINYDDKLFNEYKNIEKIDNYKKRDWFLNSNKINSEIISINNIKNKINNNSTTIELIFYLKKNKSFRFSNFTNPNFTRIIKINKNNNINVLFEPSSNNNYIYKAGNYDEIISILCYSNNSSIINNLNFNELFDIDYNLINNNNYYIYNFNKKKEINEINNIIFNITNNNNLKNTYIYYNINPDSSLNDLKKSNNILNILGGIDGYINNISLNEFVNNNSILQQFYMPYLFSFNKKPNLNGGSAGNTFIKYYNNIIIKKLGGDNFINLKNINPKNIEINYNTNEWISGKKGYYQNNFKIYAYYPSNKNIQLNNLTLANGGFTGHWQFINNKINYNLGANGINDLNSYNYGIYGSGGQGGSIIIDKNSKFTGSKGKNGVFILSFLNYPLSSIINYNSELIKKMYQLFIKDNIKLSYINKLTNNNIIINNYNIESDLISKLLNNSFINEINYNFDDLLIKKLETFINKSNLIKLISSIYIIQRFYYLLNNNIFYEIDLKKINIIEIFFVNNIIDEKIDINNNILKIFIYDKIYDDYLNDNNILGYKYIKNFSSIYNNYHKYINELKSIDKIKLFKENNNIYDFTNNKKNIIDNNYNKNDNYYKFIINNLSYIFDIENKDLKININVIESIFQIFRLNTIIYSILYYNIDTKNYSNSIINIIYENLKNFNYELKKYTDNINLNNNIFLEQNEFKIYFNDNINEYNEIKNKNISIENLLKSKISHSNTKEILKNKILFLSIIIYLILFIIILWILYIIIFNNNENNIYHFIFILIILIILIFIINYYNYYNYYYKYIEYFYNSIDIENLNEINNLQNLINMYNNNINKLIYNNFNNIYLIDNNIIYNNAINTFRKKYNKEEQKYNIYKIIDNNINEYSNNIFKDVYFKFELAKLFTYIIFIITFCLLLYFFNRDYLHISIFIFILFTIYFILNFFFNINKHTQRDFTKYYWFN